MAVGRGSGEEAATGSLEEGYLWMGLSHLRPVMRRKRAARK